MASNCPFYVGGRCNDPGVRVKHACTWSSYDFERCSLYGPITERMRLLQALRDGLARVAAQASGEIRELHEALLQVKAHSGVPLPDVDPDRESASEVTMPPRHEVGPEDLPLPVPAQHRPPPPPDRVYLDPAPAHAPKAERERKQVTKNGLISGFGSFLIVFGILIVVSVLKESFLWGDAREKGALDALFGATFFGFPLFVVGFWLHRVARGEHSKGVPLLKRMLATSLLWLGLLTTIVVINLHWPKPPKQAMPWVETMAAFGCCSMLPLMASAGFFLWARKKP